MSEQSEKNIRQALYVAVANKLQGDLSELEAKEILLTSNPAYITSKEHDHAEHIEELYNIIIKKTEIKLSLRVKDFKDKHAKKLDKKKGVSVVSQKDIGKHTQVTLKLKEDMIPWVTDNLVSDGVKIFSIEQHKNSLEDVFLEETGSDNS